MAYFYTPTRMANTPLPQVTPSPRSCTGKDAQQLELSYIASERLNLQKDNGQNHIKKQSHDLQPLEQPARDVKPHL